MTTPDTSKLPYNGSFSQSPEELLDEAQQFRCPDVEALRIIQRLGTALEKERSQRATGAEIIRAQSRDYGMLEKQVKDLKRWRLIGIVAGAGCLLNSVLVVVAYLRP